MDPNAALDEIRDLCYLVETAITATEQMDAASELVYKFEGLDEWIKAGGFLPKEWGDE